MKTKGQGMYASMDVIERFREIRKSMKPSRGNTRVSVGEAMTRLMDAYQNSQKNL